MKRPISIIILQCIVLLALMVSISLHKIIAAFEYFKDRPDIFTSYVLAGMQFIAILFFLILFIGLWKRKRFALWGTVLFFVMLLLGYNIFVVLLGKGPIDFIKFTIVNGISLFYVLMLSFSDTLRQFFWIKNPKAIIKNKKRLKNSMIFYDK